MEQLAVLATMMAWLMLPMMGLEAQNTVQLINLVGDPVTAKCSADNEDRAAMVISPMAAESWSFNGEALSTGWTCQFDWEDSSDCAAGPPCQEHSQEVKVWQGVMSHRKMVGALALTPCESCVWQIKFDGFYRANQKDLVYAFVIGWN